MSWLSRATGIHLGNIGAPIGALIGSVIPGVGTALGAGLGQGLGKLGSGGSVGQAAAQGLGAYGGTRLLQGAWDGYQQHGLGGILGGLEHGAGSLLPGLAQGAGGGGFDWKSLIPLGVSGLEGWNAADLSKQSTGYAQQAYKTVNQNYQDNAPLRKAGREALLNPQSPNLSGLDAIRGAIPGGLPSGAQSLPPVLGNGGAGGNGGLSGLSSSQPLAGGMPTSPQPVTYPGKPGFSPQVRF